MRFWSVVRKSVKEQIRQYWILMLTVSMAPFFVLVYYFINESTQPNYAVLVLNEDAGVDVPTGRRQFGEELIESVTAFQATIPELPLTLTLAEERSEAVALLERNKADALIILPATFSEQYHELVHRGGTTPLTIEFVGDQTDPKYLVSAVWANEIINRIAHDVTGIPRPVHILETGLGASGKIDEFDLYIPGISLIPPETDPPLIVDPDAVLPFPVTFELLQPVSM